jgi:TATA-box binding protein (TBP) (component of TFIID and TFIIIB)
MDTAFAQVFEHMSVITNGTYLSPSIVTMTIVCILGVPLSLEDVREACISILRTKRSFMNSATLEFGKKAMKVFSNGKLHITGCTKMVEAKACCDEFLEMMDMEVEDGEVPINLLMMNVCIKKATQGDGFPPLEVLQKHFASLPGIHTRYHPDIYQGLVLKLSVGSRVVTVLMFYTGTIMFMGIRTPEELDTASSRIFSELDELELL